MSNIKVRTTSLSDSLSIAQIHKECFKNHYLGKFSVKTIELFYKEFLKNPDIIFINCCDENNDIIGFVMGGESSIIQDISKRYILSNKLYLTFQILLTPSNWSSSFKKIKLFFTSNNKKKINLQHCDSFRLLSIAITRNFQGKGISTLLIDAFESKLRKRDIQSYGLSVRTENIRAIGFYKKMGFIKTGESQNSIQLSKDITNLHFD